MAQDIVDRYLPTSSHFGVVFSVWSASDADHWRLASAALTVSTAGSKPSGSQIRSSRDTAAPGTNAQSIPARAQLTEILCSAEKPAAPKNFRRVRSRISPRQRTRSASECSVSPAPVNIATTESAANNHNRPTHWSVVLVLDMRSSFQDIPHRRYVDTSFGNSKRGRLAVEVKPLTLPEPASRFASVGTLQSNNIPIQPSKDVREQVLPDASP